ncbi:MAG: hypothetical protein KGJ93_05405 [Patescibacteria group bacterium]|nr:hypothetical protein [Patescibacteria group bacterium]
MSVQDSINALTGRSNDLKTQAQALLDQAAALDSAIALLTTGYQSDQAAIDSAVKSQVDAAVAQAKADQKAADAAAIAAV